jgi:predicted O-methyltransferase YrrM
MSNWQTTPGVLNIKGELPFMAEKKILYIVQTINERGHKTALEWGAGTSTIWFPKYTNIESWLAIESDRVYYDYLKDKVSDKTSLLLKEDKGAYLSIKGKFDFILIDGLYRDECLEKAFDLITKDGTIILHDSGRKAYSDLYSKYPHKIIFEGEGWLGDGWDHRGLAEFNI